MIKRLFIQLAVIIGFSTTVLNQTQAGVVDSLDLTSPKAKIKIAFGFDFRSSFLKDFPVKIFGIKAGVDFPTKIGRIKLGIGFNQLLGDNKKVFTIAKLPISGEPINQKIIFDLTFQYFCVYTEYVFLSKKRWELAAPLQLGLGYIKYQNGRSKLGNYYSVPARYPFVIEPSLSVQFKLFNWFAFGPEAGYRAMIVNGDPTIKSAKNGTPIESYFNGLIYIFRVKISFGELYRDVKTPPRLRKLFIY